MVSLSQLQKFLDTYLFYKKDIDVAKIDPQMANGLMVRGDEEVEKIGFAVSASLALFKKAKKARCDALVVHHSFNLPAYNRYDSIYQNRIAYLIKNGISLFGYHFLLDSHPEIGNNTSMIRIIEAEPIEPFFHRGYPWGWLGRYRKKTSLTKVIKKLRPFMSKKATIYPFGPKTVKRIVALSGMGAPDAMEDLKRENINLFITGEVHEWNRELFREAGINFIAGGHYATEVFGVKALMEKVKRKLSKLAVEFIDVYNEV